MNLLYCGDQNIQDGLLISILSLLKHGSDELHIYVMTMELHTAQKDYHAIPDQTISFLNQLYSISVEVQTDFEDKLGIANNGDKSY